MSGSDMTVLQGLPWMDTSLLESVATYPVFNIPKVMELTFFDVRTSKLSEFVFTWGNILTSCFFLFAGDHRTI